MSEARDPRAATPPPGTGVGGMPSPQTNFVNPDGSLTPVSYRFLWTLKSEIEQINARLAAASIP